MKMHELRLYSFSIFLVSAFRFPVTPNIRLQSKTARDIQLMKWYQHTDPWLGRGLSSESNQGSGSCESPRRLRWIYASVPKPSMLITCIPQWHEILKMELQHHIDKVLKRRKDLLLASTAPANRPQNNERRVDSTASHSHTQRAQLAAHPRYCPYLEEEQWPWNTYMSKCAPLQIGECRLLHQRPAQR
jgi:hypothetical protein